MIDGGVWETARRLGRREVAGWNCPRHGGEPVAPRESRDSRAPSQVPAVATAVVSPPPSTRRLDGIVDDRFTEKKKTTSNTAKRREQMPAWRRASPAAAVFRVCQRL
jgi:hypothetical protein